MARSLFRDSLTDRHGNALSNITVEVFDEGTTTPISDTIYTTRTGPTTFANPFTVTSANRGEVRFFLDVDTGVWLDPSADVVPLFINNPAPSESPSTRDFICVMDQRDGTFPLRLMNNGNLHSTKEVVARDGSTYRVFMGNVYGSSGVAFGNGGGDTTVYRKSAGIVGVGNATFYPQLTTDPAAPATGMVTYCLVVAGKRPMKVRFPTGSPVIVATEA